MAASPTPFPFLCGVALRVSLMFLAPGRPGTPPLETSHPWAILMARATSMAAMTNASMLSTPITIFARFE